MADPRTDWGDLDDLFGHDAYEPDLAPGPYPVYDPLTQRVPTSYDSSAPEHSVWIIIEGSTNVAEMIYWHNDSGPEQASLGMRFRNGGEYHYWRVPRSIYAQILAQAIADRDGKPSTGASHWALIRRCGYDYKCIVKPRRSTRA